MFRPFKKAIKTLFHAVGLEVGQLDPAEANQYVWLQDQDIRTILDIGANVGQFAGRIHKALPEARVFCFEPLRGCYEQLLVNMRGIPNFRAFNFALGEESCEAEIHRNDYSPVSSLLPMGDLHKQAFPRYSRGETVERITVKRLDNIANELELEDNILIKIDVQGYEDKVISGGRRVISRATVLFVETSFQPLYEGQPLFAAIYAMLTEMGFVYGGNPEQYRNPLDGRILQEADSTFIKEGT